MNSASQGYALPFHNSLYSPRATQRVMWWKGIVLECRGPREALQAYLPGSLTLEDEQVHVVVTEHSVAGHDSPIFGGSIYLHARFQDMVGHYPIIAFVSTDRVLCANREELGEPTILCDRSGLTYEGNTVTGTARRRGELLLSASITLSREGPEPRLWGEDAPLLHHKKIPNGDLRGAALREIVVIRRQREPAGVVANYSGRAALQLGTTNWNFHQIEPLEIVSARFLHVLGGYSESAQVLWRSS